MKRIVLYIAQSLDGYVATPDGGVSWLDPFNNVPNVDYGYQAFIDGIDTVVQGNTTYQQFKHAYEGKQNYVFAHDSNAVADKGVTVVQGDVRSFVDGLDENKHQHIWLVGGPDLVAQFMNEGFIEELVLFVMPVLLKDGIALFSGITDAPQVKLMDTKTYKNGVVELHYDITRR